jgi:hypothetical protein
VDSDRRRALLLGLAALVAVLAVVTAFVLITDDDGGGEPQAAGATTTSTSAPPAVTDPPAVPVEATDLEDGRHPAFLTGLDVESHTVEVNVIQILTGQEAQAAYEAEYGPGGEIPYDEFIVDENPRLRTLTLAPDVQVTIVEDSANPIPFALSDLPARFAGYTEDDDGVIWPNPFWLTVEGGVVTAIDEKFMS